MKSIPVLWKSGAKLLAVGILLTAVCVNNGQAAEWKNISSNRSLLQYDDVLNEFPGTGYSLKGWDDSYSRRIYYFGSNVSLGTQNRIGLWLYDLAPGRLYPDQFDVEKILSVFNLFKSRSNNIAEKGTATSHFSPISYVIFSSNGVPCTALSATFGETSHMGTVAGTQRLLGFFCRKTGDTITNADVEAVTGMITVKKGN